MFVVCDKINDAHLYFPMKISKYDMKEYFYYYQSEIRHSEGYLFSTNYPRKIFRVI